MAKQKNKQPLSVTSRLLGVDFVMEHVWKCPKKLLEKQFINNISLNHLEVGVTSGFDFTQRLKANNNLDIAYLDPDIKALKRAVKNSNHLKPRLYRGNLMYPWGLSDQKFSSINLNFVLHCLPGDFENKVNALCINTRSCLADDGTIFGSAILRDKLRSNPVSEYVIKRSNQTGIMNNEKDSYRKLERMLNYYFNDVNIKMVGYVVMFEAKMKVILPVGSPEMEPYNSRRNLINFPNRRTNGRDSMTRRGKRIA
ncbi:MAG: hypothetical protein ACFHVJ_02880 [Aestuariibacter sp.]